MFDRLWYSDDTCSAIPNVGIANRLFTGDDDDQGRPQTPSHVCNVQFIAFDRQSVHGGQHGGSGGPLRFRSKPVAGGPVLLDHGGSGRRNRQIRRISGIRQSAQAISHADNVITVDAKGKGVILVFRPHISLNGA